MPVGGEDGVLRQSGAQRCTLWDSCGSYVVWKRSRGSHIILVKEIDVNRVGAHKLVVRLLLWRERPGCNGWGEGGCGGFSSVPAKIYVPSCCSMMKAGKWLLSQECLSVILSSILVIPVCIEVGPCMWPIFMSGLWMEMICCHFWVEGTEKQVFFLQLLFTVQGT